MPLGLFFSLVTPVGDFTPGGASDALLLEDGVFGYQLEDGSGVLLMESA